MKIVTSGSPYLDIDGYAGCVAYAEFLRASGLEARAVSTSILNNSITSTARSWPVQLDIVYRPDDDSFIIIDTSSPDYFDKIVNLDKVEAIIDHHPGSEEYWHQRLGERAFIEPVGSACTLVYEAWQKAGMESGLSSEAAKLMTYGILDNTLNLSAALTDVRDRQAYRDLVKMAALPADWAESYFADCDRGLRNDFPEALRTDIKTLRFKTLDTPLAVGQIAVWDIPDIVDRFGQRARSVMSSICPHWFVNFISIAENRSYFLTSDISVARWLANLLGVPVEEGTDTILLTTDLLWLRKEILHRDIEASADSGG